MTTSTDATDLCRSCGLCCNGMLVDYVPIEEQEVDRLKMLGFELIRDEKAPPRFNQPCPKYCGDCSIYAERPRACSRFRCDLLESYEAGQIPFAEAAQTVAQAKQIVGEIERLLGRGPFRVPPLKRRRLFDEWVSKALAERPEEETAVMLEFARLQRFLEIYFGTEEQQIPLGT